MDGMNYKPFLFLWKEVEKEKQDKASRGTGKRVY